MFPDQGAANEHGRDRSSAFEQTYWCYSASSVDKPQLENGNKVIMPPSALHKLTTSDHMADPLLFELQNMATNFSTHCGVLEFVANENTIYLPCWIMESLMLENGDTVKVRSVNLPKATYVKLRPHDKDFTRLDNPKIILQKMLQPFSCLTVGHTISVNYNNKEYHLDIVEAQPGGVVCITDTEFAVDLEIDHLLENEIEFGKKIETQCPEEKRPSSTKKAIYISNGVIIPPQRPSKGPIEKTKSGKTIQPFAGVARRLNEAPKNVIPGESHNPRIPPLSLKGNTRAQTMPKHPNTIPQGNIKGQDTPRNPNSTSMASNKGSVDAHAMPPNPNTQTSSPTNPHAMPPNPNTPTSSSTKGKVEAHAMPKNPNASSSSLYKGNIEAHSTPQNIDASILSSSSSSSSKERTDAHAPKNPNTPSSTKGSIGAHVMTKNLDTSSPSSTKPNTEAHAIPKNPNTSSSPSAKGNNIEAHAMPPNPKTSSLPSSKGNIEAHGIPQNPSTSSSTNGNIEVHAMPKNPSVASSSSSPSPIKGNTQGQVQPTGEWANVGNDASDLFTRLFQRFGNFMSKKKIHARRS